MMTHCQAAGRRVHLVNLDPAAEHFEYEPTIGKNIDPIIVTSLSNIYSLSRYPGIDHAGRCNGRVGLWT